MKWKPKVGEMYYFPLIHGEVGGPMPALWQDSEVDNERYKMGVVCRTKSEEMTNRDKINALWKSVMRD